MVQALHKFTPSHPAGNGSAIHVMLELSSGCSGR
jgi:hypothetical protein